MIGMAQRKANTLMKGRIHTPNYVEVFIPDVVSNILQVH